MTQTAQAQWYCKPTAGHEIHGQSAVYSEDGKDIAIVYDGKAHGDLIAAAPALLAALGDILQTAESRPDGDRAALDGIESFARAAIAAAKGGE